MSINGMKLAVGVVAVMAVQGCVSDPGPTVNGNGTCNDSTLGWIVGQEANETNMRRVSAESGAGLTNPIGPASIVSKDSRRDRLRVYLDKDNRVLATRCE